VLSINPYQFSMLSLFFKRIVLSCVLAAIVFIANAQTQEDFNTKLSDVYTNAADKKKALVIAKELYGMVEKKKDLQTYTNYYLLKNIFEIQAPDAALAKTCADKADKAMNAMVGQPGKTGEHNNNPFNQWYYVIYPGLFDNKDPQIATKALDFINKNPSFKTADSYNYIAYAFERKGDFQQAKKNYEISMSMEPAEKNAYRSYMFYTNFLSKSGDYLKADEYIRKMEQLSQTSDEMFRTSYKSEAMGCKVIYYLNIGDFQSYAKAEEENVAYSSVLWHKNNKNPCNPYPGARGHCTAATSRLLERSRHPPSRAPIGEEDRQGDHPAWGGAPGPVLLAS